MTRPSRNIDKLLIETGIAMLNESGVAHLNVRELVKRAGVNLGMFHYHFKTKEAFTRVILQELYESIFENFTHNIDPKEKVMVQLRQALRTIAFFVRDHRHIVVNIGMDVSLGDAISLDFARANFPRHINVVHQLIIRAQKEGSIVPLPTLNVLTAIASSIATPSLIAIIAGKLGATEFPDQLSLFQEQVLTDAAIDQRIDIALKGVSA